MPNRSSINGEVGTDTKSFNRALEIGSAARSDVILIGEMRNTETMQLLSPRRKPVTWSCHIAYQDAPQTIDRIVDVFPPHQQSQIRVQLGATLMGICTQQLLPTVDGLSRVPACEILIPTQP